MNTGMSNRIIVNGRDVTNDIMQARRQNQGQGQNQGGNYIQLDPNTRVQQTLIRNSDGSISQITRTISNNRGNSVNISRSSNSNNMNNMGNMMNYNSNNFMEFVQQMLQHAHGNYDNPVENDLLSSLPEFPIEDINKLPEDKKDCIVCLTKYENKENAIILPCTHFFHKDCIKDWFKRQNTCPICKFAIDRDSING